MDQIGKEVYPCKFYESCGSPVKNCKQGLPEDFPFSQHIYYSKMVGKAFKVKLLCSNKWIFVDAVCPMKSHVSKGYHVHGVRQWSIGAGHNTTCRDCLIKLAQRKLKTDYLIQQKLIECASKDPK